MSFRLYPVLLVLLLTGSLVLLLTGSLDAGEPIETAFVNSGITVVGGELGAVADLIKNNCGKGDKITVSGQLMYVDNKPNSYHWMMIRDFEPALWPNQRAKAEAKGLTTQNDDMPY